MSICYGSPMLDIIANVDDDFLEKYNLKKDTATRIDETNAEVFETILKYNPIIQLGGSVTNTVRVFQWLCKSSDAIAYVATIGHDNYGKIIKQKLDEENINYHFIEIAESTGKCAVLVSPEGSRTLVADLGASRKFKIMDMDENIWQSTKKATNVSFEVMTSVVSYFVDNKKKIVSNLGSRLQCQKHPKQVRYLVDNSDVVIGNEREFRELAHNTNLQQDSIKDIILKLNESLSKNPNRILIVTSGSKPITYSNKGQIFEYPVHPLKPEHVVDSNGAGDAFAGGFLAKFLENKSLEDCVKCGVWCSKIILQNHGCSFDNTLIYDD